MFTAVRIFFIFLFKAKAEPHGSASVCRKTKWKHLLSFIYDIVNMIIKVIKSKISSERIYMQGRTDTKIPSVWKNCQNNRLHKNQYISFRFLLRNNRKSSVCPIVLLPMFFCTVHLWNTLIEEKLT